ncbi:MAG TPA: RluA family pseudouridine synthase [Planctomycetaceae bacterium]|nr:RluA family pseudouridine synthase [Planctomycetaceae bacterium]
MKPSPLVVLFEDNHCLAVSKPAGWLTMGDETGDPTLLDAAKAYIKERYNKPGAVFLGVVHRLDRPVSGVVLFARTSKAAARLSAQFRDRIVEKVYWAAVTGTGIPAQGELVGRIAKDRDRNVSTVTDDEGGDSRLAYRVLNRRGDTCLLEIRPLTGRSHQIRVQLAHAGWPIVGDRKYGSPRPFEPGRIALHARSLTVLHPVTKQSLTVTADVPARWDKLGMSVSDDSR